MQGSASPLHLVRFGVFEVDLRAGELRKSGLKIRLQEKPFQVLAMLLEHPGEIVTRDELQKKLWPENTFVDFDHSMNTAVTKLREALGDTADNPRFVETLARRGYRFIAPVEALTPSPSPTGRGEAEHVFVSRPSLLGRGWFRKVGPGEGGVSAGAVREPPLRRRRIVVLTAGVLVAVGAILAGLLYFARRPPPTPKVSRFVQLTSSGRVGYEGAWMEAFPAVVTDGARLYFTEWTERGQRLAFVSAAGGEIRPIDLPMDLASPAVLDISPDGSQLLIRGFLMAEAEAALWLLPTAGGAPLRVGNVLAHAAAWSRDGRSIFYGQGNALFVTEAGSQESRKLRDLEGRAFWLRASPDGSRLRFTCRDTRTGTLSLWEINTGGTNLHALLAEWTKPPGDCCGQWTPDGRFFTFQSYREGRPSIWALRDKSSGPPILVTAGPLDLYSPVPSRDGKKLFVVGVQGRGETMKYDPALREFVPFLPGRARGSLFFSRDRNWIVEIDAQGILWRMKADGSQRLQLTSPPLGVGLFPNWSPDSSQIAFVGTTPGGPWKIYLVSRDGGTPRQAVPGERNEVDPDWSPDGNTLVFGRVPEYMAEASMPKAIHLVDLRTRKVSTLPGSEGLFSPHWSPDGRYIAATTLKGDRVMLFDFTSERWTGLVVRRPHNIQWSRDSKYVYAQDWPREIFRVRIADRRVEPVAGERNFRRSDVRNFGFLSLAPDESPLVGVEHALADLYALDWEAP
jgi:Tol biopolymer transport system component/DNA-binding winged helix-turn-helix (wHTH) protein